MSTKVYTYSAKEQDIETVESIKEYARDKGLSMSWIILKSLKEYQAKTIKGNDGK